MAGTYDQLKVLNDHAYSSFRYKDYTRSALLGAMSGGSITMRPAPQPIPGNFYETVVWKDRKSVV